VVAALVLAGPLRQVGARRRCQQLSTYPKELDNPLFATK
jgi:hypothetical protein